MRKIICVKCFGLKFIIHGVSDPVDCKTCKGKGYIVEKNERLIERVGRFFRRIKKAKEQWSYENEDKKKLQRN